MAELKREAQRATGAGSRRESVLPTPASTTGRGVRVVRNGQVVSKDNAKTGLEVREPEELRYVSGATREIVVGDKVKLRSFGSIGIVDSLKGDEAEVRVKSLRLREKLTIRAG